MFVIMEAITDFKYHGELHHFEGYYMDLDSQRVWSEKYNRWLKTHKNRDGYVTLCLTDTNGKQLTGIQLSRLVWTVANGRQIPDGYEVNHIDEDKSNNHPSNLNLMTRKENVNWETRNARARMAVSAALRGRKLSPEHVARIAAAHRGRKQTPEHVARIAAAQSKAVAQLTLDGKLVAKWPSTMEAHRNGWNSGSVSQCCRKCFTRKGNDVYKGYRWQWLEDYEKAQAV